MSGANTGKKHWYMRSEAAVANVEAELTKDGKKLRSKVSFTMASEYRPELDVSRELSDKAADSDGRVLIFMN
jgi:hypothetical protein